MSRLLDKDALKLYLCTDRDLSLGRPIEAVVEAAIRGGVTMVQVREKNLSTKDYYLIAKSVQKIAQYHKIPLVVNDRLDVALAVGADGVHLGQSDMPVDAARRILGSRMFIGVSVSTIEEALAAEVAGADYLGISPVFNTGSKADAGDGVGLDMSRRICAAVSIPCVGIGGINAVNAASVLAAGCAGVAVISAIVSQGDIEGAARTLWAAIS
jgi:thiamine-phosphate pyrophosphorylase